MQLIERMQFLEQSGLPFALATVVRAEKPTSAKPGAKAILTADGQWTGWIGGSCAEPTVKREALKALQDGQPRLIRLCPPEKMGALPQEGVTEIAMTCISGGTLEIYLEPYLSQPHLVAIGHLATTEALTRLAKEVGLRVSVVGLEVTTERFPQADRVVDRIDLSGLQTDANTYIVVASHGNYDEEALEAALQTGAGYVGLVASKARSQAILRYLRDSNLPDGRIAQLKYPAGLDFGAVTPEEIALSILAEIVQLHRRWGGLQKETTLGLVTVEAPVEARDPVCGMSVEIATARYVTEWEGHMYYFCAKSCQRSFETEPEKYLAIKKET